MINSKALKKIAIILIIISLFLTFSVLVAFSDNKAKTIEKKGEEHSPLDDGEDNGSGKNPNIEDLILLVQETTSKHLEILTEALENAPEPAKKGIERAIKVSVRGGVRAIEVLNRIKNSDNGNKVNSGKTFHIISSCNRGGIIEPKGIQFSQGESVGFIILPEEGYELVWIRVDNKKLEAISDYSFDDIDSNHTIHAHFKKIRNSSNSQ